MLQLEDEVVQILDFKGQVYQVFGNFNFSRIGKRAQLQFALGTGKAKEHQFGTTRRGFLLQDFHAQNIPVKPDGLFHVGNAKAGVEIFFNHA